MDCSDLEDLFGVRKPLVGMLHLLPLPGSPRSNDLDVVRQRLMSDAESLVSGGIDGMILENYGDAPYHPNRVGPHTIACMTVLGAELVRKFNTPLGINVLRNDGLAALAVASAIGAKFVRINMLMGVRAASEGLIEGEAYHVLQYRRQLSAKCLVFADVDVKHSAAIGDVGLPDQVDDVLTRGLADAIIVSGLGTGKETDLYDIKVAKHSAGDVPVFVGSGATSDNADQLLIHADGLIAGTGLKHRLVTDNIVDARRVRGLVDAIKTIRG